MSSKLTGVPGTFVWHDLLTPDANGSIEFYRALLGWQVQEIEAMPGVTAKLFVNDGVAVGGCVQMSKEEIDSGFPPCWTQYICVADLDEALAAAEAEGGKKMHDAIEVPGWGRFTFVQEPDGATVGFWQELP